MKKRTRMKDSRDYKIALHDKDKEAASKRLEKYMGKEWFKDITTLGGGCP